MWNLTLSSLPMEYETSTQNLVAPLQKLDMRDLFPKVLYVNGFGLCGMALKNCLLVNVGEDTQQGLERGFFNV